MKEKEICERKLTELEEAVVTFDYMNRENEYKRINSRLIHISDRLNGFYCKEVEIERFMLVANSTRLREKLNYYLRVAHNSSDLQLTWTDQRVFWIFRLRKFTQEN